MKVKKERRRDKKKVATQTHLTYNLRHLREIVGER